MAPTVPTVPARPAKTPCLALDENIDALLRSPVPPEPQSILRSAGSARQQPARPARQKCPSRCLLKTAPVRWRRRNPLGRPLPKHERHGREQVRVASRRTGRLDPRLRELCTRGLATTATRTTTSDRAEGGGLLPRPAGHSSTCLDADARSAALPLRQAQEQRPRRAGRLLRRASPVPRASAGPCGASSKRPSAARFGALLPIAAGDTHSIRGAAAPLANRQ
jgi:hypothetical protein